MWSAAFPSFTFWLSWLPSFIIEKIKQTPTIYYFNDCQIVLGKAALQLSASLSLGLTTPQNGFEMSPEGGNVLTQAGTGDPLPASRPGDTPLDKSLQIYNLKARVYLQRHLCWPHTSQPLRVSTVLLWPLDVRNRSSNLVFSLKGCWNQEPHLTWHRSAWFRNSLRNNCFKGSRILIKEVLLPLSRWVSLVSVSSFIASICRGFEEHLQKRCPPLDGVFDSEELHVWAFT